jgi:Ca2+-binding RTX toxin-like protein
MFNSDGTKLGGEITLLNLYFDDLPDLVTLADGRVAVTWHGSAPDGTTPGIFMQILDPREGIFNGTANADKIYGNDGGNDYFHGLAGADTINGLRGNDTLYGDAGIDIINGGRGDDNLYGGTDGDNLRGDVGDDELYGDAGGDTLLGGLGADFLNGGDGTDFANYHFSTGVTVDMNAPLASTGEAFGDSFFSIEGLVGSASAADILRGDTNGNTLYGQGGADTLDGRGGSDILLGGAGIDILTGGTGPDKFRYVAASEGGDTITDYEASDDFQFVRAAFGNLTGANVAAVNFLSVASGNVATTATHRFIFDQALDQLWYDADGSAGGAAVLIADLNTNINITHLDLLLI